MNLENKRILVTGGRSFLGKTLVPLLEKTGAEVFTFSSKEYDLRKEKEVKKLFLDLNPEIVIHLAVDCGGNKYNKENARTMFNNNAIMDKLIQDYSKKNCVQKFVGIGSSDEYSSLIESPFREEDVFKFNPNNDYGLSKRKMLYDSQKYRREEGFNAIHLIFPNLYGPNFSLDNKSIRIIPLLIDKFEKAMQENAKKLKLTGTKEDLREFLYIEDGAKGIIKATELYDEFLPLNLGSGISTKIGNLAEQIKEIVGFGGEIIWNDSSSKYNKERFLDITRAKQKINWEAETDLKKGLKKTLEWYRKNV